MYKKISAKTIVLLSILTIGFLAQYFDWIDLRSLHQQMQETGQRWWMPATLVIAMTVFYAFALPGSLVMLSSGVIYPPMIATPLSVAGGVAGALSAFFLARFLSEDWTRSIARSPLFKSIKNHTGFIPFCLLRIFPGFPHSIINYSAGILNKNLFLFAASTAVGFTVKGFVYTSASYNATHFEMENEVSLIGTIWPLLVIILLSLTGYMVKNFFANGNENLKSNQNGELSNHVYK